MECNAKTYTDEKLSLRFVTHCSSGNLLKGTEKLTLILVRCYSSWNPSPHAFCLTYLNGLCRVMPKIFGCLRMLCDKHDVVMLCLVTTASRKKHVLHLKTVDWSERNSQTEC
jgi:hypothetical protein